MLLRCTACERYDDLIAVKETEFDEMEQAWNDKKKTIGDNAATISSTSAGKSAMPVRDHDAKSLVLRRYTSVAPCEGFGT